MTMTTIFRDLPNDLVEEILCYIPATYLKRLKSTCRQWNRLFNGDNTFARKHTDKAPKQLLVLTLKTCRICPTIVNMHGPVELKSELSLVDSQSMDSDQFDIALVYHCDGLLLCISEDASRFLVWNPFTGETRWFQPSNRGVRCIDFAFGYYQDDNNKKSYKILSFSFSCKDAVMYEYSSDSWRSLDAITPPGWIIAIGYHNVSLKGNTYWFAKDAQDNLSLLKFDFQTEKSVPVPLPYQRHFLAGNGLSVVGEEKLSVLLQQRHDTSKTEIWVTNKIDKTTQVMSWSKVLVLDLCPELQNWDNVYFWLDEEKKIVRVCVPWFETEIYTVGGDGEVTQVERGTITLDDDECAGEIFNYVPSLVQIEQAGGKREKM